MGFKKVIALAKSIKGIKQGKTVTPKGLAAGQSAPTPQKFGIAGKDVGMAYANGGKITPQRG